MGSKYAESSVKTHHHKIWHILSFLWLCTQPVQKVGKQFQLCLLSF